MSHDHHVLVHGLVENYVELLKTCGDGSTCLERLNGGENDSELKVK